MRDLGGVETLQSGHLGQDGALHTGLCGGVGLQAQDQVQGGFLLDVVVAQGAAILELLACKNQALLIRWDTFFVLDLGFGVFDGVGRLHVQGDGFSGQRFDKDLHGPHASGGHEGGEQAQVSEKSGDHGCRCR